MIVWKSFTFLSVLIQLTSVSLYIKNVCFMIKSNCCIFILEVLKVCVEYYPISACQQVVF